MATVGPDRRTCVGWTAAVDPQRLNTGTRQRARVPGRRTELEDLVGSTRSSTAFAAVIRTTASEDVIGGRKAMKYHF